VKNKTGSETIVRKLPRKQSGASVILMGIVLAVLAYGVYVGINYMPIMLESMSLNAILKNISSDQQGDPITTEHEAEAKVIRMLQINEMDDMAKHLKTRFRAGTIEIKFSYERELDLGFQVRKLQYEKVLEVDI
jgi:hypothetical protein